MLTSERSREMFREITQRVEAMPDKDPGGDVVALFSRIWIGDWSRELEPAEQVGLSHFLNRQLEKRYG